MEFSYTKCEGESGYCFRPYVPITLCNNGKEFHLGNALIDTGADFSIFPIEIAHYLEIQLDDSESVQMGAAGGGLFKAMPSRKRIECRIEQSKFRPIEWKGILYFTETEDTILLGHKHCLEHFDITFKGKERKFTILPLFKHK